jgi:hypothetical protein
MQPYGLDLSCFLFYNLSLRKAIVDVQIKSNHHENDPGLGYNPDEERGIYLTVPYW